MKKIFLTPLYLTLLTIFILTACGSKNVTVPTVIPTATVIPATKAPLPTSTPQPTETPIPTPTMIPEKDGMALVFVPAGEFTMGSSADNALAECQKFIDKCKREYFVDEEPSHTVNLDAFWIDQTEVTNAMYAKCVNEGICKEPAYKRVFGFAHSHYYGNPEFDNYPVNDVDWSMAKTYCEWVGRRLPTEAEWEKAARGTDGRIYPWGNTFDGTVVNFCDTNCLENNANKSFNDGYASVSPVGNYPSGQSIYGAYDMAGNVSEWVSSLYKPYPYNANDGREDLNASGKHVLRGGAFNFHAYIVSSADRLPMDNDYIDFFMGFRCARSQ